MYSAYRRGARRAALVFVFANFVADQCARSSAAHGAQRAAKNRIAHQAASGGTYPCADLRIGGVGRAAAQGQGSNQGRGPDEMTCVQHGVFLSQVEMGECLRVWKPVAWPMASL